MKNSLEYKMYVLANTSSNCVKNWRFAMDLWWIADRMCFWKRWDSLKCSFWDITALHTNFASYKWLLEPLTNRSWEQLYLLILQSSPLSQYIRTFRCVIYCTWWYTAISILISQCDISDMDPRYLHNIKDLEKWPKFVWDVSISTPFFLTKIRQISTLKKYDKYWQNIRWISLFLV